MSEHIIKKGDEFIADKLQEFYNSEIYKVIKRRHLALVKRLNDGALVQLATGKEDDAKKYVFSAEGVKLAIEVTERLSSEIRKGQFDADVVLDIIENKPKQKGNKWLTKLLGMFQKPKK